jgi:hypothetical protein
MSLVSKRWFSVWGMVASSFRNVVWVGSSFPNVMGLSVAVTLALGVVGIDLVYFEKPHVWCRDQILRLSFLHEIALLNTLVSICLVS